MTTSNRSILAFGATGPTGQLLVNEALAAGHRVTAYVRNPAKLDAQSGLSIVQGELSDAAAIEAAVAKVDAVISVLGPSGRTVGTPIADGTRHIVAAMEKHGVRRLIAVATPSASDPQDRFAPSFRFAVGMMRTLLRSAYDEIVATAGVIRSSKLDWTLLRLPMLSNAPASRPAVAGYLGDPRIKLFSLSRDALVTFALRQLDDDSWIRAAPVLSNG